MDFWLYLALAVIVLAVVGAALRARRKKQESTDDIYPMW
jgi:hypothetical protein